jgi:energy-coupling factor transport system ATP-binding protein
MNSIEISHLAFKYKSWVEKKNEPVFTDLNLNVKTGNHLLILSKPEGGKTTFSRILNGLIPKFIDGKLSGSISLNAKNIEEVEPYDLINDICYVSQNPLEMFVSTTCENEVAFPLQSMGIEQKEIEKRVSDALSKWGLSNYAKASPFELSGGERKRLLLAVSNAIEPSIYILDEAFDDLDKDWRDFLANEIKNSNKTIITLSARYLVQFEDSFDEIKILENGIFTTIDESEAIQLFTHKDINTYLEDSVLIKPIDERVSLFAGKIQELSVKNLIATRKRESIKDEKPFKIDCPDFSIKSCEVIRLIGSNGSGKSTFSRILCGLDQFESGSITLNDKNVIATKLQSNVGYLFQNPDFQIFLPTIYEELAWGLSNSGKYSNKQIKTMVADCAKLFSLDIKATPTTMSFALRKRLQAAVYYLLDRPFLILDELDGAMSYDDAYFIINELSKKGCALVIITHDDDFAKDIADKTYIVDHGKMEVLHEC